MLSRAHILIQKEISDAELDEKIKINKINENDIFELVALLGGLPNTHWENGIFQIYMKFTEDYNFEPPSVYFQTIPYHPNIEMGTGRPNIDFLDNKFKWKQEYNIKYILKSLQHLLAYPLLDRAANMDAVFMLKGNPSQYENIVKQSVLATQRIRKKWDENNCVKADTSESKSPDPMNIPMNTLNSNELNANYDIDLVKFFENENSEPEVIKYNKRFRKYALFTLKSEEKPNKGNPHAYKKWNNSSSSDSHLKNISFDDYCTLWKGIATSKATKNDENVYLKHGLLENPNLLSQHLSISIKELEEQVYQQLNEHKNIMYGKFEFTNRSIGIKAIEENIFIQNQPSTLSGDKIKNKESSEKTSPKPVAAPSYLNNSGSKNFEALLSNSQLKSANSNQNNEFNVDDDFSEQEVDDLINWTKNIIA